MSHRMLSADNIDLHLPTVSRRRAEFQYSTVLQLNIIEASVGLKYAEEQVRCPLWRDTLDSMMLIMLTMTIITIIVRILCTV